MYLLLIFFFLTPSGSMQFMLQKARSNLVSSTSSTSSVIAFFFSYLSYCEHLGSEAAFTHVNDVCSFRTERYELHKITLQLQFSLLSQLLVN